MGTTVAVTGAVNFIPPDGVQALVTVEGTPTGSLVLMIAPPAQSIPAVGSVLPYAATETSGVYRVAVAHAGLWYIWAEDSNYPGIYGDPVPVWVGLSEDVDLNLLGLQLVQILTANQSALEAAIRVGWNGEATIKHITYGTAAAVRAFPAILVTKPRETSRWVAFPSIKEYQYRFDIYAFIMHQDPASILPVAVRLAGACMSVLNLPAMEEIMLPSGTVVAFAQCAEGEADDAEIEESTWAAIGSAVWTGTALKQTGAP